MQAPPLDVLSETEFDGAFDYVVKTGKRAGVDMEVDGESKLLINREVDRRCGIHPVQRASDGAWSILASEDAVIRSEGAGFVGLLDVDTSELMIVRVDDLLSLARLGGNVRVHRRGPIRVLRTHRSTIASALTHKVYDLTGGGEAYISMRKFLLAEPEQFVHLHNHSIFSMLDGASSIEGIADRALANGQPGIALTDHGFMHGLFKHYHTCRERGIKPILGCLVKGQEIVTNTGIKPIEKVAVGDMVLTHKGRFRAVTRIMKRRHRGRLFTIHTARGGRPLKVTDEHPIYIRRKDGSHAWLRPGEIDAGRYSKEGGRECWKSWVALPKIGVTMDHIDVLDWLGDDWSCCDGDLTRTYPPSVEKWSKPKQWGGMPMRLSLDRDFGYLMGMFCAEGSFQRNSSGPTGLCFTLHANEVEHADRVTDIMFRLFGVECTQRVRPEKNIREVYAYSVPVACMLRRLVGSGAKSKHVPSCIFEAPRECRDAFIEGLIDGDGKQLGATNPGGQRNLRVASRNLAWGFRTLLADRGFWSSVSTAKVVVDGRERTCYTVSYSPDRKYSHTIEDDDMVYRPVRAVEVEQVDCPVYNIEVEEDHSYVSDFILHNCEVYMVDDLAEGYVDAQGNRRRWEYHQTLIAMNQQGWKNLCYLSSLACERHFYYVPRIDHKVLFDHSEGIICLSGCFKGMVANYMQKRQPREGETALPWWLEYSPDRAREYMRMYRKHFGDRYYIELQNIDFEQYMQAMPAIKQMADEEGIPAVASVDCHYELAEDAYIQSIVTRISSNSVGDGLGEQASTKGCYYIRPRNEVDCPTFTPDILNRTCEIMDRCTLELPKVGDPGFEFRFPKYDVRSDEDWAAFQKKGVA